MNTGFYRAIVCENNDPDKLGKLRVTYPWYPEDSSERPSEWVEICLPYASSRAGFWFLPEIGDEVLVYSESGNLGSPIVFGAIHSQQHLPPLSRREGDLNENNRNDLKFVTTRTGHTLCFDDSDSKRSIVIKDEQNRRLEILSSEKKLVLSDDESNQISITPEAITIQNKNGDEVVLEKNSVRIKSQNVKIDAASSVELGSGAAEALVKGQSFMAFFNAHTHTTTGPGSPTSPPTAPMTPSQLSTKVKTA